MSDKDKTTTISESTISETISPPSTHPDGAKPQLPARQVHVSHDVVPILDTAKFEQMQRVSAAMARSSLLPDHLVKDKDLAVATANCLLVVNQAVMWEMDPFAVAQAVAVVHGKLCYEGKLIHAVIEAKLGIRLSYEYTGDKGTERRGVKVIGRYKDEDKDREVDGTVEEWKVTQRKRDGSGETSAWVPKTYDRMLAYRGAREWARRHAPGVILGVYSRDEMYEIEAEEEDAPPPAPKNITPIDSPVEYKHTRVAVEFGPEKSEPVNPGLDDLSLPPALDRKSEENKAILNKDKAEDIEPISDQRRAADTLESLKGRAPAAPEPPQDGAPAAPAPEEPSADAGDGEPPSAPVEPESEPETMKAPTADSILDAAEVDFRVCKTPAQVRKVQDAYKVRVARMMEPDQQEFQNMAKQALERTAK